VKSAGPPHLRAVETFRRAGRELEIRLDCACPDRGKLELALGQLFYAWRPLAEEVARRVPTCNKLVGVLLARLPAGVGVPPGPDQLLLAVEKQLRRSHPGASAATVNSSCAAIASVPRRLLRAASQLRAVKPARDLVAREVTEAMEDVEGVNGSLFE